MTNNHAVDLSIEVWSYLEIHPDLKYKSEIPPNLYKQIKDMKYECPMCEIHSNCPVIVLAPNNPDIGCPLFPCTGREHVSGLGCKYPDSYSDYVFSSTNEMGKIQRLLAAHHIVEMLQEAKSQDAKNIGK